MNWSDERYVKLYSRDTATWLMWPWQARALLPLLLRKADGAGLLDCGTREPLVALSVLVGLPLDVVRPGLEAMEGDGTLERVARGWLLPRFLEAQEATKTPRQKKKDQRERDRAQAREISSPPVTESHPASPSVTECPPPAQPSPAQPISPPPSPSVTTPTVQVVRLPVAPGPQLTPADLEERRHESGDNYLTFLNSQRVQAGLLEDADVRPETFGKWFTEVLMELGGDGEHLDAAVAAFSADPYWQKRGLPLRGFMSQWRKYAQQARPTKRASPSRPDADALGEAQKRARPLDAQLPGQLALAHWRAVSGYVVGTSADPYWVAYVTETYPGLEEVGVRVELVEQEARRA